MLDNGFSRWALAVNGQLNMYKTGAMTKSGGNAVFSHCFISFMCDCISRTCDMGDLYGAGSSDNSCYVNLAKEKR